VSAKATAANIRFYKIKGLSRMFLPFPLVGFDLIWFWVLSFARIGLGHMAWLMGLCSFGLARMVS